MSKPYHLVLQIDGPRDDSVRRCERTLELSSFETMEEAIICQRELEFRYSAMATGESLVAEEMTSPENFLAGD